jgi:hypothetical protein
MRRDARKLIIELACVQTLDAAADLIHRRIRRAPIGALIEIRPGERHLLDHLDVRIRVQVAKGLRHQIHHIDVRDLELRECVLRGTQRLRGAHVTRAGRDAENENAFALHTI